MESKLPVLADKPTELIFGEKYIAVGDPETIAKWRPYFPNANI